MEGRREGEEREGWASGEKRGRADGREKASTCVSSSTRRNSHSFHLCFSTCPGHPLTPSPSLPWISILRGAPSRGLVTNHSLRTNNPMAKALLSRWPRSFSTPQPKRSLPITSSATLSLSFHVFCSVWRSVCLVLFFCCPLFVSLSLPHSVFLFPSECVRFCLSLSLGQSLCLCLSLCLSLSLSLSLLSVYISLSLSLSVSLSLLLSTKLFFLYVCASGILNTKQRCLSFLPSSQTKIPGQGSLHHLFKSRDC